MKFFEWLKNLFRKKPQPLPEPIPVEIEPAEEPNETEDNLDTVNNGNASHPDFNYLWDNLKLDNDRMDQIRYFAKIAMANKERYQKVADAHVAKQRSYYGQNFEVMPWWFVAGLHYRESTMNFDGVLHNGQKIIGTGRKTTWVPKGRGPFYSWEEAAIDALFETKNFHKHKDWNIYHCIEKAERYNGLGYRYRIGDRGEKEYSPYLFAGTNFHDETSKYTSDGKYSAIATEKQLGVCTLWLGLKELFGEDIA